MGIKMKRTVSIGIICLMCMLDILTVIGSGLQVAHANDAIPTGKLMYIALAESREFRWNANGEALLGNEIHLDSRDGENCLFRFDHVENNWYGIKHIKEGGTDRFADIDGKSKDPGAVLHLWETDDDELKGNNHRQFAFEYQGTDEHGNKLYYIKNRNSGLYMGYEDTDRSGGPSADDKIIQTTASNKKLWVITDAVVPKTGDEITDLVKDKPYIICSLFESGTLNSVNRQNDIATNGTRVNLYEMGTSSKWRVEYVSEYEAYEFHAITDGEKDQNSAVMDVVDESNKNGASVNVWDDQDKTGNRNTSQLWRIIRINGTDDVYIQNAKSGRYLSGTGNDNLTQSITPTRFTLDIYADNEDPVNFEYSKNWMKDIPDNVYLSSVNIPGTHDSGTASVFQDDVAQLSLSSCQKYYYGEQLNIGIRSMDIRAKASDSSTTSASGIRIYHGITPCYNKDGSDLTLENILSDTKRFLQENPSEAVVMMIKNEGGNDEGLARAMGNFIKNNKKYVWTGEDIPSMGEARGKMVFIRRYEFGGYDPSSDGLKKSDFGLDLANWDDFNYKDAGKKAISIYKDDKYGTSVYVQDAYNTGPDDKKNYIAGTLEQTTAGEIPEKSWIYNYTSCTGALGIRPPLEVTREINPWMFYDKASYFKNDRLGMVMMNFVDIQMSKLVYETNFNKGADFFEIKEAKSIDMSLSNDSPHPGDKVTVNLLNNLSSSDVTYQWYADGTAINGATKQTYTASNKDIGKTLSVKVKPVSSTEYKETTITAKGKVEDHSYDSKGFCTECGAYEPASKSGDTYQISNAGNLFWFAALVNGDDSKAVFDAQDKSADAVLTQNIDLAGHDWTPIGGEQSIYVGTFDGNGNTISNLTIANAGRYSGMFGYSNGVIKNFTLTGNITVTDPATGKDKRSVAGIVGRLGDSSSGGTVSNVMCGVNININEDGYTHIGGIVGSLGQFGGKSIVEKCAYTGDINATETISCVGGIAGYSQYGTIQNCYNLGDITGKTSESGGILGYCNSSLTTVANCYNYGTISIGESESGAVIGANKRSGQFTNCYWLEGSATSGVGSGNDTSGVKNADQFASGEVCYLLNGQVSDGTEIWKQDVDTADKDLYPVFEGPTVYKYGDDIYTNEDELVCVNVSWGSMEFDYVQGAWDPDTHIYSGSWTAADAGANKITVKNIGNVSLDVDFAFNFDEKFEAYNLAGTFTGIDDGNAVLTEAETVTTNLKLTSLKPDALDVNSMSIGEVTVTIKEA